MSCSSIQTFMNQTLYPARVLRLSFQGTPLSQMVLRLCLQGTPRSQRRGTEAFPSFHSHHWSSVLAKLAGFVALDARH